MYGAPPPMMVSTYHPGVYERPQQTPYLDFGNLFKVLVKPQEAFENLYDHTSQVQGWILAIIFIVVTAVVSIIANFVILGDFDLPDGGGAPFGSGTSLVSSIINIPIGLAMFWLVGWIVHAILKNPSTSRRPSMDKTLGLMGYAKFPAFILMLIAAVVMPLSLQGFDPDASDEDILAGLGGICGAMIIYLIALIWALFVHGHAQSVANDCPKGTATGIVFVAWFVTYLITAAITIVIFIAVGIGTGF